MPAAMTAANSDANSMLAARYVLCGGPARRAKRCFKCDEAVACRTPACSGTASLASAETSSCPCARLMTTSSQESSRYRTIRELSCDESVIRRSEEHTSELQ